MVTRLPTTNHNHSCDNTTYHMTLNRSGFFANAILPSLVYMLLGLYRKKPTLPASMLRPLLETFSPDEKVWTDSDLGNTRKKIQRLYTQLNHAEYSNIETFTRLFQTEKYQTAFIGKESDSTGIDSLGDESSIHARRHLEKFLIQEMNKEGDDDDRENFSI